MPNTVSSIWAATAVPAPATPALTGSLKTDVLVVGAGFTGLTAALRLAEGGASVLVADSHEPGYGASGRNGGQVIPGLKLDPDELDAVFGEETTAFAGQAADVVFDLVERYGIDCEPQRSGWIQPTVKQAHVPVLEKRLKQWQDRGADCEWLDADPLSDKIGSRFFVGGWFDKRAGTIHPLNYARGLARAAQAAGVRIHGGSEVTSLKRRGGRWLAQFATGASVTADNVIVATNGYSGSLWPALKRSIVPVRSFQVATVPLSGDQLERILPARCGVSDTRRVGHYFRIGSGGRAMIGGRGGFSEPSPPTDYRHVISALHAVYPALASVPLEFFWSGTLAMTQDHLPHIHEPAPGLTMVLGYNGRGVAMASAVGTAIGAHLLDPKRNLPLKLSDIRPLPLHALHPAYASIVVWYYRLRDALET